MTEKYIEQKLREKTKQAGGIAMKFVSPGFSGVPDRLVCLQYGKFGFAETKKPGQGLRPRQKVVFRLLQSLGFVVEKIDHPDQIDGFLKKLQDAV